MLQRNKPRTEARYIREQNMLQQRSFLARRSVDLRLNRRGTDVLAEGDGAETRATTPRSKWTLWRLGGHWFEDGIQVSHRGATAMTFELGRGLACDKSSSAAERL